MRPYEIVKTNKKLTVLNNKDLFEQQYLVAMFPIEVGTIQRVEGGWVQIIDGKAVATFELDEIVWRM